MSYTHLDPGKQIEVSRYVYFGAGEKDVSDLVLLSLAELTEMEQSSIEQEKAIFDKMCAMESEWAQQAEQTIRLRQAKEYLRTPSAKHTSNKWSEDRYGWHERSNMVYRMTWRTSEDTKYDRVAQKSISFAWSVSWYLSFNTPKNPDDTRPGRQIAGQDRKRFGDKAAMEKYLQGRIAAYAHLFTEISPPIPKDEEGRFSVNSVLLPGYTVEVPERTTQEVADDLLELLDDEDMGLPAQPVEKEPSADHQPQKPAPKHPPTNKHRKSAPTR